MPEETQVSKQASVEPRIPGNGSVDAVNNDGGARPSNSAPAIDAELIAPQPESRATGPRTSQGKLASSKNALKFGILSKELVIRGARWIPTEKRKDFDSLLQSYVDHFRPQGPVEMHQVELAVGALWRYRRLLRAEAGEIKNRWRELDDIYAYKEEPELTAILKRCGSVPGPHDIERLQRYETHLLRIYYRALNELERLQRMRLGDAVPAPFVVEVRN